ncbi:unnamed protein product [Blepharisma stoltei]|uniref:Transmembrane protein n=1 Tax=Blepharisma stoltei TaxID=1481888 RepID=A0AAU9K518_9CILI|nr:unnamed protein product [Blepharisma stoltei]
MNMFNKKSDIYQALYSDIRQRMNSYAVWNLKKNILGRFILIALMITACIVPWYYESDDLPYVFLFMLCDIEYNSTKCKNYWTLYDDNNCGSSNSSYCDKIEKNRLAGEVYLFATLIMIFLILLSIFGVYSTYSKRLRCCKTDWANFIFPIAQSGIVSFWIWKSTYKISYNSGIEPGTTIGIAVFIFQVCIVFHYFLFKSELSEDKHSLSDESLPNGDQGYSIN